MGGERRAKSRSADPPQLWHPHDAVAWPAVERRGPARLRTLRFLLLSRGSPALHPGAGLGRVSTSARPEQIQQHGNQRLVGGGHRVVAQIARLDPGKALALAAMGEALPAPADP